MRSQLQHLRALAWPPHSQHKQRRLSLAGHQISLPLARLLHGRGRVGLIRLLPHQLLLLYADQVLLLCFLALVSIVLGRDSGGRLVVLFDILFFNILLLGGCLLGGRILDRLLQATIGSRSSARFFQRLLCNRSRHLATASNIWSSETGAFARLWLLGDLIRFVACSLRS